MPWQKNPNCAQCRRPMSEHDLALGTVCASCVAGNRGRVWASDAEVAASERASEEAAA